jgi:protein-S-isoprenylcysteine O-methyltransferase Ste14
MRFLESRFPAGLFVVGLIVLGYATIDQTGFRQWVVILYLLWVLAELRITFRLNPGETGGADRGSLQFYGLSRAGVVVTALLVPVGWSPPVRPWLIAAVAVMLAGVAVRLTAIVQLGRFYSHKVRTLPGHQIVQTGLYGLVRHPAYLGMIVAHVGFVACFANPASIAALILLVVAIVRRVLVEEQTLMHVPGYSRYAADHARLLPAVW